MRYTVKIGLEELTHANPDMSKVTFDIVEDEKYEYGRLKIGGTIEFFGKDYDFIKQVKEFNSLLYVRIWQNGLFFCNAQFDINQAEDLDYKRISGKLIVLDEYTDLEKNKNVDFNIITGVSRVTGKTIKTIGNTSYLNAARLWVDKNLDFDTFAKDVQEQSNKPNILSTLTDFNMATENIVYPDGEVYPNSQWGALYIRYQYNNIISPSFKVWAAIFAQDFGYGIYDNGIAIPPDTSANWSYDSDEIINGIVYPKFTKPVQENTGTDWEFEDSGDIGSGTELWEYTNPLAATYFGDETANYYTQFRRLTDVLEFLVKSCDNSIRFDSQSFNVFSLHTGETITSDLSESVIDYDSYTDSLINTTSNNPFAYLLIMTLSDAIPEEDGTEKDYPALVGNLSFEKLMNWLWNQGYTYYLEEISGDYYFRLQHKLFKNLGNTNPNLRNYFGKDWIKKKRIIDNNPATYNVIRNTETSANIDFNGTIVEFTNIAENQQMEWGQETILTDIDDIRTLRNEKYNENSIEQFVVFATNPVQMTGINRTWNDYQVRKATGLLTGFKKNNVELSFANLAENMICDYPDKNARLNGKSIAFDSNRLEKRQKIQFLLPVKKNIKDDFTFNNYISYFYENANITKLTSKGYDSYCQIEIKK